jgi:hypothetical protein
MTLDSVTVGLLSIITSSLFGLALGFWTYLLIRRLFRKEEWMKFFAVMPKTEFLWGASLVQFACMIVIATVYLDAQVTEISFHAAIGPFLLLGQYASWFEGLLALRFIRKQLRNRHI